MNQGDLSKREIIKYVRNMLKENSAINHTTLCTKIYGKYDNSGPYFNKTMNLFRKITGDQALCEEIKSLDLNLSESSSEEDEVQEFRIIDLSKKPNDDFEKTDKEVMKFN
jgi:hypothetical protein